AVMLAPLPPDSFRRFAATADPGSDLPRRHQNWIDNTQPTLGLIHADPRCPDVVQAAVDAASASGAFLVGGLVSHRCETPLIAGGTERGALGRNGISGLLLSPEVSVATALTQGCTPIGPVRRIDEARDNVVMAIDRMLKQLAGRLQGPPKAGIYVSCIARGAALFGERGIETGLIREQFDDIPLIGFFANGEISRDRLYGHTGVLTLFT